MSCELRADSRELRDCKAGFFLAISVFLFLILFIGVEIQHFRENYSPVWWTWTVEQQFLALIDEWTVICLIRIGFS